MTCSTRIYNPLISIHINTKYMTSQKCLRISLCLILSFIPFLFSCHVLIRTVSLKYVQTFGSNNTLDHDSSTASFFAININRSFLFLLCFMMQKSLCHRLHRRYFFTSFKGCHSGTERFRKTCQQVNHSIFFFDGISHNCQIIEQLSHRLYMLLNRVSILQW